jgi:GNAT superfamily N-acetyltransferase
MSIRLATTDDAWGIATVHVLAWKAAYVGIVPQEVLDNLSIESRTERWQGILSDSENKSTTWVYEEDAQILGWCSIGPNRDPDADSRSGELWAIYVLPNAQKKGVGRALMQTAISGLRQRHCPTATLWVLTENHNARAFYEETGWKLTKATKEVEMGGKPLSETRYRIDLGPR